MLVFFSTKFYTKVLHAKNNYTNVLLAKKKKTILLGNLKSIRQVLFALFNFESSCWKNHPCLLNNGAEFMPCRKCYKRQRLLQHKLSTSSFINH